jgi:outer membrane protein OmpA-like peptidoglycan-associated protein
MLLLSFAGIGGIGGCANKTQEGAAIGVGAGAVVGGAIGKATGNTARGAIIGAAVGGAAGAIIGSKMDKQAKELDQEIPGATVTRVGEGIAVTFDSGLLFDFNSATLRPEARENLRNLAASLAKNPGEDVLIVGHTDSVGTDSYNLDLSRRRADAAASYIATVGVDRSRINTRGMGENDPVAANDTDAGRQQNRRVEVAIYANDQLKAEAKAEAASGG